MEWVEVTAKTVEEAKDEALDQLGVDESEAEFEVLEEPKAGLFGRLRSEARVRARVAPTSVRPKIERGSRKRGRRDRPENGALASSDSAGPSVSPAEPAVPARSSGGGRSTNGGVRSGPASSGRRSEGRPKPAADKGDAMYDAQEPTGDAGEVGEGFLSGLISAFGVTGSVSRNLLDDGDTIELAVEGDDVGMLIGPRGQTLSAIQELTRTVAQRKVAEGQPRIVVDVAGYRKDRREALERFTRDVAAQVVASGVVKVLEPMPPADRKVVHDTANSIDGVTTSSEGEEPRRRVVIQPTDAG
ncbi:MAG TPA: RNA-binding cell elongation regulator Jag/EloR [Acidimicrobiales bacterium]|nr:RNA-binding cell elongation regulator Jag/EloR [Acidimicrobiales bacterium]